VSNHQKPAESKSLSLHLASIETSHFPKAFSHSRSAGFRAAVPHGVLGCFYIKPNFPGRCSRTEQSKQMHIKTKECNKKNRKGKILACQKQFTRHRRRRDKKDVLPCKYRYQR